MKASVDDPDGLMLPDGARQRTANNPEQDGRDDGEFQNEKPRRRETLRLETDSV